MTQTADSVSQLASANADCGQIAGQYYLPGAGPTYLNPQFADRVGNFITNAQKRGADVSFLSGYRTQAKQDALHNDPTATTPARNSLHSEGWAVDIDLPRLPNKQVDQSALAGFVSDAHAAGLKWGGNFAKPDPGHFYYDPGGDRVTQRNAFTGAIAGIKNAIPDD